MKIFFGAISDRSGPKKTGPGRARALNVGLGPGPSLSPSFKAGLRAGGAGLTGSVLNQLTLKILFHAKFLQVNTYA